MLLAVAAAPLAMLGGWLASRDRSVAAPYGSNIGDAWWRHTMPWPHGVQEDDDVHWNFGGADADPRESSATEDDAAPEVTTVRLRPAVRRIRR